MLSLSAIPLAACDLFGGDGETDATLYKVKLSYSSNVNLDENDLKAQLAFGVDGRGARDDFEIEELKKAGASDEDIAKVGVKQSDGYYYFFDQDPIIVDTPTLEGYILEGMYYKGTDDLAFKPNFVDIDGNRQRWNVDTKGAESIELEARYIPLSYTITYCYGIESGPDREHSGLMPNGSHNNPASFNYADDPDVTLAAPQEVINGYEFKYWYYTHDGSPEKIKCEKLPTVLDETFIHAMTYVGNKPQYGLTLFAFYDIASHNVTYSIDDGITATIKLTDDAGNEVDCDLATSGSAQIKHGYCLDIWVDTSEIDIFYPEMDHVFDGIYINGKKIADLDIGGGITRADNHPSPFPVDEDMVIEVKVKTLSVG